MNIIKRWKREFVRDWLAAWNAHDLDRIMAHYADAIEFTSPFVVKLLNDPGGLVIGKPGLRAYFERGLARNPDLHFRLLHVLPGVASITLFYESVNDLIAAERSWSSTPRAAWRGCWPTTPKLSEDEDAGLEASGPREPP